jgi:polyadenylation factor subunit 2
MLYQTESPIKLDLKCKKNNDLKPFVMNQFDENQYQMILGNDDDDKLRTAMRSIDGGNLFSDSVKLVLPQISFINNTMSPYTSLPIQPAHNITTRLAYCARLNSRSTITCSEFSSDGTCLYFGNDQGYIQEMFLYRIKRFNNYSVIHARTVATKLKSIQCLRLMKSRPFFFLGGTDGRLQILDQHLKELKNVRAHCNKSRSYSVTSIALSPCLSTLCSGSEDNSIKFWDLTTIFKKKDEGLLRTFKGHTDFVLTLSWHPEMNLVASGSKDYAIKFWDPRSELCVGTNYSHTSCVQALEYNGNGYWLLSGGNDHTCRLFDLRNLKEIQTFKGHQHQIHDIAWHPNNRNIFVSCAEDGGLASWLVGYESPQAKNIGRTQGLKTVSWHPQGRLLATGSRDACVKLWTQA